MPKPNIQALSFPAPSGGWDTASPPDQMPINMAYQLRNLFPDDDGVTGRGGSILHCDTADATSCYALITYSSPTAEDLISAHESGAVYDVTTSTPATLATGYSSSEWSWVQFSNSSGHYVIAANDSGSDVPWVYDGATITPIVVTGVTDTNLSRVCVYLQRVFFVERNTLSLWYAAAGAFQGALTELDLSSYATKGGAITALATWTRDNGTGGMDDMLVVVTTRGQLLVFNGIDPSVSTLWVLTGVFDVGLPVSGPNCLVRTGPDLILLGSDGYRPISDYLALGRSAASESGLSRNISGAAKFLTSTYREEPGWCGIVVDNRAMMIINSPQGDPGGAVRQQAANLRKGAWCEFTGMTATTWGIRAGEPYFAAANGKIYRALTGFGDGDNNDEPIAFFYQSSFQAPTGGLAICRSISISPVLDIVDADDLTGYPDISVGVSSNYGSVPAANAISVEYAKWGELSSNSQRIPEIAYTSFGRAFSVFFSWEGVGTIKVYNTRLIYEAGGRL